MANTETVAKLYDATKELEKLLSYFDYEYSGEWASGYIEASEKPRGEFDLYDYKAIYKKIDEVLEKIKGIDTD